MGNCCAGTGKDGEAIGGNLQHLKQIDASAFLLKDYQTKFVPQSFSTIAAAEKDQLLAEALKIIIQHGDLSRVKPTNINLREILKPLHTKFNLNGDQFEGDVIDGIANGKAKVTYKKDGCLAEGTMGNGSFKGEGTYSYPDGTTGKGTFIKGIMEGICHEKRGDAVSQLIFAPGNVQTGPEYITNKDQSTFTYWKNGQKEGLEVSFVKSSTKISLTEYKEDKPVGAPKEFVLDPSIKPKPQQAPAPAPAPPAKTQPQEANKAAPTPAPAPAPAK